MRRTIAFFSVTLILVSCVPAASAEQQSQAVVDAMLGIDPRTRRSSGAGAALDSIYGQQEEAPQPSDESTPEAWSSGLMYGDAFKDLRSPLFEEGPSLDDAAPPVEEDPNSSFVPVIPLGRPEAREGVMYEDAPGY